MLKLKLKKPKPFPKGYNDNVYPWSACLPFLENERALLIHRPREVSTLSHKKYPYLAIKTYCGTIYTGDKKFTFLELPPESGKLLCSRCEKMAVDAGLPSASELAGKHIHQGKLVAIQTCCEEPSHDK